MTQRNVTHRCRTHTGQVPRIVAIDVEETNDVETQLIAHDGVLEVEI